ncbi:bifunctional diguanylate cyclase/phosphodiesterase [Pleionea sp. CnH1-48]|uniref:putative bifunctional diguanylate cyclase/phosphodiesterase n=1 Tax=Pleionea sp. CnH1-48 TaxID=2954494 RepID=UPI0020982E89|nr:EAL domain-containing protein [Pleionea sp. CnH1-48]MCO7224215.1 EAL domain-containing protein [Pleionea sp. CnH1-48]
MRERFALIRTESIDTLAEVLAVALEQVQEAILIVESDGRLCFVNQMAEDLLGIVDYEDSYVQDVLCFVNKVTQEQQSPSIDQYLSPFFVEQLSQTTMIHRGNDYTFPFLMKVTSISPTSSESDKVVISFSDETQMNSLLESVSFHRKHDALTGLANRMALERQLQEAIQDARINDSVHCLCFINIDQTKLINDSVGHLAGDEMIREVAECLKARVRSNDMLARLGGDEFALLLKQQQLNEAHRVATKLSSALSDFCFNWDDRRFVVSVSIGIVEIDLHSDSWVSVLSKADSACQKAKSKGRNQIKLYNEQDNELATHRSEVEWVSKLVSALHGNCFQLFQQRVFGLGVNQGQDHCEVLIRMTESDGHIVSPGFFLPAAERYNMAGMIDRWVVLNTMRWMAENRRLPVERININLSALSILQDDFIEYIESLFDTYLLPPENICFEITETAAIANYSRARSFIEQVKAMGCFIALDDFGTGMCSFAYLKNLPVDYLKIDGEFVKGLERDSVSRTMVRSINDIAHAMNIKTVAEYVENEAIKQILEDIQIDYAQGFGLAKPAPLKELRDHSALLTQHAIR